MSMPEAPVASPITIHEAEKTAADLYGLEAEARRLPGEYDDNFHLRANSGQEYVLKIMHPARERELVDLQCRALEWLAKKGVAGRVPAVLANREGELFTLVRVGDSTERLVWMLSYVPGKVLAGVKPHAPELLDELGCVLGEIDRALADFEHPAARRKLKWDSAQAGWICEYLSYVKDERGRRIVSEFLALYEREVLPNIPKLRQTIIYGDANDYNVIVNEGGPKPQVSVVDFGDIHKGITVSEIAIAGAYAILGKSDPLAAAAGVVRGYHSRHGLREEEIAALFPLMGMRLAVSVVNSAHRQSVKDDPYVTVSEAPAWAALERLVEIHPRFAEYVFRDACGLHPVPNSERVVEWLKRRAGSFASVLDVDVRTAKTMVFDLSMGSKFLGSDPQNAESRNLSEAIFGAMKKERVTFGFGRYDEVRSIYCAPQFATSGNPTDERRTVHLGIDLFVEPGANIRAPLDGEVYLLARNDAPLDYGPLVILKHAAEAGDEFFTLYGHLAGNSVGKLRDRQKIAKGEAFAQVGTIEENGGWPPHLHLQIILDLLELEAGFPGVALPSQRGVWKSLSPDPNLLLGIPAEVLPDKEPSASELFALRDKVLGGNLSLSYRKPLNIVRGWRQYLYDESGRAYMDVYNNVPLVGHSHPRVVRAIQEQVALLNTNTRYLHENVVRYAERLSALLPQPLGVCYFVNSGSEANELALRLARAHTGRQGVIVLEHAYHGHTTTLIDVSPYKFDGPGGQGRKPWVYVAPLADVYRGRYREDDPRAALKYAGHVAKIIDENRGNENSGGRESQSYTGGIGAFLAETLPSVGGQIVFPPGYLKEAYRHVRAAGAVCIADEVQVGFGRLGSHFWGFETQDVVPDIVVFGKPIGNAFPLAAVVTTVDIAKSFDNGMEFFSTFGGNPVACAAGLAVLDVLEEEQLQSNALRVGTYLMSSLKELQRKHELIGDVRGMGLFLGIDLVVDRETRAPATQQASYIVNRLRERGILTGTDGPFHNVIKLRPPLIFSEQDADLFVQTLDSVLEEDSAQP
jgi:4-aminobutyrate aminotransferase-like enzyme/Ser/Thr protein kinase RdoA (MazF antagonist)